MSVINPDCDALTYLLNAVTHGGILPRQTTAIVCEYGDNVFSERVTVKVWQRGQKRGFTLCRRVDCTTASELANTIHEALTQYASAGVILVMDRPTGDNNMREMSCIDGNRQWSTRYPPT